MGNILMVERGPRRQALTLALLALAVAVVALAAQQAMAAALLALALVIAGGAALAVRPARRRPWRPAIDGGEAAPTLRLELKSGEVISARPVALPGDGEDQLLLTRGGYVVVDRAGRVLHKL